MKFIDNPIGSTFSEGEVTLEVRETKDCSTCTGCWYARNKEGNRNTRAYTSSCYIHRHACTPANRKDRKQVIFAKI